MLLRGDIPWTEWGFAERDGLKSEGGVGDGAIIEYMRGVSNPRGKGQ